MKHWLRRIWRTVYHTVSFVWFTIAILVTFLWIQSYWVATFISLETSIVHAATESPDGSEWMRNSYIQWDAGTIIVTSERFRQPPGSAPSEYGKSFGFSASLRDRNFKPLDWLNANIKLAEDHWTLLGLGHASNDARPPLYQPANAFSSKNIPPPAPEFHQLFWFPFWALAALVCIWPLIWGLLLARAIREFKRMAHGHCGKCNYDLRGDPAVKACPECGAAARLG